jgi:hypothetical protein
LEQPPDASQLEESAIQKGRAIASAFEKTLLPPNKSETIGTEAAAPHMNAKWQNLQWVLLAGAVGGITGWVIGVSNSGSAGPHWPTNLVAGVLGGAVAGAIGVYLLANTDPTQFPKILTFALVCGLSWQAILETGRSLAVGAKNNRELAKATEKIDEGLTKSAPDSAQIQTLADNTTKVAEKLPAITDPQLRKDAVQTATKAVDKLQTAAFENPDAVSALEQIGKQASASGSTNLEVAAKESLKTISTSNKASPLIKQRATAAFEKLSKTIDF